MSEVYATPAGAFAMLLIQRYLDDVHAAANPGTPEEVGGAVYKFFKEQYSQFHQMLENGVSKREVGDMALATVRAYVGDESLSGKAARAVSPSAQMAYLHFSSRMDIIDRLEAGESSKDVLASLRDEDGPSQMPDGPSSPGQG